MSRQITAVSARGKTSGMKMNVRKITIPRSLRLTRTANARASTVCTGTTMSAKVKLFSSAWPKAADRSGSVNSRLYCSNPMNRAGRGLLSCTR